MEGLVVLRLARGWRDARSPGYCALEIDHLEIGTPFVTVETAPLWLLSRLEELAAKDGRRHQPLL